MKQELIEQIYGGEKTAEATKLLKYIYAGAQPIEDNDFALMFGRMNLAKFVEVKAKEDEIRGKQVMRHMKDKEQKIDELRENAKQQADALAKLEQDIIERDAIIANLREQNAKQADIIKEKKLDNFDLQADIDRLRHQLEAIKNVIAL